MPITAAEFAYVQGLVRREAAIVLPAGKEYLVEARLMPLARGLGLADASAYVSRVMSGADRTQQARIVDALTTNETSWFRDAVPFRALESEIIPTVLSSRSGDRVLRVWSAACSSGQEPYSIAMTANDAVAAAGWSLRIAASDISTDMLARARAGRYSQLEVSRGLPASRLARHFTPVGTEWQINDDLRRLVSFSRVNLATAFPAAVRYDVVFLRNVLIYFDPQTKRDVLRRLTALLRPGGFLVLGGAETTMGVDGAWERVVIGRTAAYRLRPPHAPPAHVPATQVPAGR